MLRIRLSRIGKKKQPSYRVVVADIEAKRDGRIVERLGHYDPLSEPIKYQIKEDRALYWLSVGAQPTDAVRRLLETQGTLDRLARLRQGEDMDELVAEYTGIPIADTAVAEVADEVAVEEMAAAVATELVAEEE
jgi:small subunit ribosomal protein S16